MKKLQEHNLSDQLEFDLSKIFIGREKQVEVFISYLHNWLKSFDDQIEENKSLLLPPSPNNRIQGIIVLLHGRGGFGKSTLLRHYHEIALRYNQINVSKVLDWEFAVQNHFTLFNPAPGEKIKPEDYFNVLRLYLSMILEKKEGSFKSFQEVTRSIEQINKKAQKVIQNLQQKDDSYSWLREAVSEGAAWALREFVPGGKLVLDEKRSERFKKIFGESLKAGEQQLTILRAKLQEKLKEDFEKYLEPDRQLAFGLGKDLAKLSQKKPLLIFFDTYEEIDEADNLLRLLMLAAGNKVGWVIAGRSNLWAGKDQRLRSLELEYGYSDIVQSGRGLSFTFSKEGVGEFTLGDIEEYFHLLSQNTGCPPIDSDGVVQILKMTRGIPLAVKIAAGLYKEVPDTNLIAMNTPNVQDEIVDVMVQRYLMHVHSDIEDRSRLYGLAMLRKAEQPNMITAVLGIESDKIETDYSSELRRLHRHYSFIFTEKEKPTLHQDVRFFLRKWLLEHRKNPDILKISHRLFQVQEKTLTVMEEQHKDLSLKERFQNSEWTENYLNYTEQFFWIDSIDAAKRALPFIIAAAVYNRDVKNDMIEVGKFFRSVLDDKMRNTWDQVSQCLIYQKTHNANSEILSLLHKLEQEYCHYFLKPLPDYSTELKAILWWLLGEAYTGNNDIEAVKWYEKSLSFLSDEELREAAAESAYFAANNFYTEHNNTKAIEYWKKITQFTPENIAAYYRMGRAYTNLGENKTAIEYFHKALTIDSQNAHALTGISTSYRYIDLEKAIKYAEKATEIHNSGAESFDYLGLLYRDNLQIDKAIEAHKKARQLDPRPVTDFFLSLLHVYQKNLEQAKLSINVANESLKKVKYATETRKAWIKIIQWGKIIITEEDYVKAMNFIQEELQPHLKTARTARASMSHIEFLLNAYGKEEQIEDYKQLLQIKD